MSFVVIIRGPLGCGKTTAAKQLADSIGARHFSIDHILEDHHLAEEKEDGYISQKSFLKANDIFIEQASGFLRRQIPVVVDGNFYWKSQIEDLECRLAYPHIIFTFTAPLDICIERDSERANSCGRDAVKAVYAKTMEFSYGIEIDATSAPDEIIEEIQKILSNKELSV